MSNSINSNIVFFSNKGIPATKGTSAIKGYDENSVNIENKKLTPMQA